MKKVLLSVLATVCIMGTGCAGVVGYINNEYHTILDGYDFEYEVLEMKYNQKVEDCKKIKTQYEELQEQVWNVLNDENYTIRIKHEDEMHTYTSEKENFLFTKKSHSVTK